MRDEQAVRRFVEHTAMTLAEWGFPRMPAKVLMTIMSAEEDSLSAGELADRLDVSPAAVSGAVRYLTQIGLLAREPVRGSRRDHYRMPNDAWYEAMVAERDRLTTLAKLADEGVAALGGPGSSAGARVADMADFSRFTHRELAALLDRWKATKAAR